MDKKDEKPVEHVSPEETSATIIGIETPWVPPLTYLCHCGGVYDWDDDRQNMMR